MNGLAQAERLFDGRLPVEQESDDIADSVFDVPARRVISDSDVEATIATLAESGCVADEFGRYKMVGAVYRGIAVEWVRDRASINGVISAPFWRWAKSCTSIAMGGL